MPPRGRTASSSICPQGGAGEDDAHRRLAHTLKRLQDEGLQAIGQVTHPDPYTAIQQALHFYGIDEIVISTFPETRSGWLRGDLVGRVEASTDKPVHHVVVVRRARGGERLMESASIPAGAPAATPHAADHGHEHHGPPAANQSSRLDAQILGMLLFIISEIMLFGAFFTAYFFIRVVNGRAWPAEGEELPKLIAGVNTAILVSSSFTMHWALEGARHENRRALRIGLLTTLLLGATFLTIQINEYFHIGFAISENAQSLDLLLPHRPPRRARLRRPDAADVRHDPRLPRPLHGEGAPRRRDARGSTGTSSTSCGSWSTRRSTSSSAC